MPTKIAIAIPALIFLEKRRLAFSGNEYLGDHEHNVLATEKDSPAALTFRDISQRAEGEKRL